MSDIEYWKDEYAKEIDELGTLVNSLKGSKSKDATLKECDAKFSKLKDIKKSYGLELRLLKDKALKAQFDAVGKEFEKQIADYQDLIKLSRSEVEKEDLLKGAKGAFGVGGKDFKDNMFNTEGKDNDKLLSEASKIQDKTLDATSRIKAKIEESRQIGTTTLEALQQQRQQMIDITADVDRLDVNVKKAAGLMMNFAKRMASDKCIQVCSCVNVCLILAVIIYVSVTKKNLGSSTTVVSPSITQSPTEAPTIAPTMRRRLLRHPLELSTDVLQIQSDVNREAGEYVFTSGTHLRGTTLILDEQALFFQKRSFFSFF